MKKYRFENMPDKTVDGVIKELRQGLTIAAVYFQSSLGFPLEYFNMELEKLGTIEKQLLFYMVFRNRYPKLYENLSS